MLTHNYKKLPETVKAVEDVFMTTTGTIEAMGSTPTACSLSSPDPGGALPYWVILGMCGQNGWVFQAENLRMGVNF